MLIETSFEQALAALREGRCLRADTVVPASEPLPAANAYRPEYAWQYGYERRLLREQAGLLGPYRHELLGAGGLFSEILSNAYAHGNARDATRPITVELFAGQLGFLLRVSHSGPGFDVSETLRRYRKRQAYYLVAGHGLRRLAETLTFGAFFSNDGRAVHLLRGPLPSTH